MPESTTPAATHALTQCPRCSAALDPHWSFCPQCAAANPASIHDAPAPRKHENSPVRNAFGGFYFGVIVAPACLILGAILTITGIGIFIGIPLLILGILAPLLGTVIGLNELKGKCPWCGARITSVFNRSEDFACPACGRMIAIHNRELQKAA